MRRETHTQVLFESKIEDEKRFSRQTTYQLDGFWCDQEDDRCDVVNGMQVGCNEARERLQSMLWIEEK